MATSCYANWVELDQLSSDNAIYAQPLSQLPPLPPELPVFDYNYPNPDPYLDPYFLETQEFFYSDSCTTSLLPYFDNPYSGAVPEFFQVEEYKLFSGHKRQKPAQPEFVPNPCLLPEFSPGVVAPFPEFAKTPVGYGSRCNSDGNVKKAGGGGGSLSAQSIAARQRRRRITEKTQELGKHIPGGQKMNTAEMFHAAYKFIKFLQAQVRILEMLPPVQENEETSGNQELHDLLCSPLIQEKLYSAEKCLVPTKFVQSLSDENQLQPNRVLEELKNLL